MSIPPVEAMMLPPKVEVPVPTLNVLLPVIVVGPFSDTAPVPVEKVPVPDWMKFELFWTVTVPLDVNPEVAVINPEMVGVVVQLVPVTVKSPPRVVRPVPTLNVFAPDISVLPFNVFAPLPVVNIPAPICEKFFPSASVVSPFNEIAPDPVEKVYDPTWTMLLLRVVGSLMVSVPGASTRPMMVVPLSVPFEIRGVLKVVLFKIPSSVMLSDELLMELMMES
jgi:hypothetical protein